MAKVQKNKDGSTTSYPKPGEQRTGISYDQGRTYRPTSGPNASDLAQGSVGRAIRLIGSKPGGEGRRMLDELKSKKGKK